MINLYDVVKHKTDIIGFWKEGKVIYKDYIQILEIEKENQLRFNYAIQTLFKEKNQLAIFYKIGNFAFIQDRLGNVEILKNVKRLYYTKLKPTIFKKLLKEYNGFTLHKRENIFMFEIWQA